MAQRVEVLLFGDQTYDFSSGLRDLLQCHDNPILASFFERVYHSLRLEIAKLTPRHRDSAPRFSSIAELLSRHREGGVNVAFEQALTCLYQLAFFISAQWKSEQPYPVASDTYLLGFCTGTLSAAAIASSKSLSQLLPAAVQAVIIAFRTGLIALDVGSRIQQSGDGSRTWSIVLAEVNHIQATEELYQFYEAKALPLTSQPYISARGLNSLTISGPPNVLSDLRTFGEFAKRTIIDIPIHAPYHASHLYNESDVESILETTLAETWTSYTSNLPIISSVTGKLIWAGNFRSLLQIALSEILREPIRWDCIATGSASILRSSGALQYKVVKIATTAEQTFHIALRESQNSIRNHDNLVPQSGEPSANPSRPESPSNGERPATFTGRSDKSKIAIIGMSGRFPDASNPDAFWHILHEGLDVHKVVPPNHWDAKTHVDTEGKKKNTSATPYGCWLENPGMFDARFFNMSPREAPQVDPAQRIALLTAYEAIEQAGITPDGSPSTQKDRVGVFYGVTSNDWMETNSAQDIDTYFIPGGNRAFIPGRINYFFKFSGPSYSVDTACSSSLAAIHVACNSLWRGDIDTAIAGGTNILTNPDFTSGLDRGHFLSRTGNCKTFDDGADGYCRGEGVGTVILKRLEDAIAENDPIQGLILGAYTNHSADAESITRPHIGAQKAIFNKILSASGIEPYSISYVEMHGTGTQAGDAGEMEAVLTTFAPAKARVKRHRDQPLYLGSAKANIGHGEAASGVSSLAKVLLMMRKNIIPPHCGIKTKINHKFPTDFQERNVHIASQPIAWDGINGQPRRVFLNNFSAAGGNTALLLEDAPPEADQIIEEADPRTSLLVAVSAKCYGSLKGNIESLISYLSGPLDKPFSLPRLSYTTSSRRIHHPHRVIVGGSTVQEIKSQLEEAVSREDGKTRPKSGPEIVFTFTGQGSQYPAMAKQLYESFSQFRADINRLDRLAQNLGFPSVLPIFTAIGGDIADYTPVIVQLASTCMQIGMAQLWASLGIIPKAVVGHSLGEFAALNVAGVLSDSDCIYLVGKRANLLQEQCSRNTHSMLAVQASVETLTQLLAGVREMKYEVACMNSPVDTVLSGPNEDIQAVQKYLTTHKLKMAILKVPYAFHSSQVDPILKEFEAVAQGVTFSKPVIPVLCPLFGNVVTDAGVFNAHYLARHCREPVNMLEALRTAKSTKVVRDKAFFIEVGPHPAVSGMVKATLGSDMTVLCTLRRGKDTWAVLSETLSALYLAGSDIRWMEYHRDFKSCHKVLQLPAYNWDLKNYWMQYVNDWSLRKGDALPAITQAAKRVLETTSTVHRLVEETTDGRKTTIIAESDISRPDLNPLVQGHKVNGVPLCTPSVYADIALTLGTYLNPNCQLDISDMIVEKALIAKKQGPQLLRTRVVVDRDDNTAICHYYSVDELGHTTIEHANCLIRFVDESTLQDVQSRALATRKRMEELRSGIQSGETNRFNKSMVYKMVSSLAQFHPDYRAIREVVLASNTLEAASRVDFADVKSNGVYHTHPAFLDGLTQSGGFVMNANDAADVEVEVFINHGWKSFQLFEEISADQTYETYVKMGKKEGTLWEGDIVVFNGDKIAASIKGIVLLGVSRRVLHYILAVEAGKKPALTPRNVNVKAPSAARTTPDTQIALAPAALFQAPAAAKSSSKFSSALRIISEESGIELSELTDSSVFADMGVDSLLTLTIASRFREELDLDFDFESIFLDLPTVKDFRKLFEPTEDITSVGANVPATKEVYVEKACAAAPIIQPAVHKNIDSNAAAWDPVSPMPFTSALRIISEESGVSLSDLTDDCVFSDMGVDSLLTLVIASRFREELAVDLDFESMFMEFQTVRDLRKFWTGEPDEDVQGKDDSGVSRSSSDSVLSRHGLKYDTPTSKASESDTEVLKIHRTLPVTTSIILQGLPSLSRKMLFLFPDGSGSSTSYSSIPRVNADVCVVGLNSPFVKKPQEMTCSLDELIESYLVEIRRRQPEGPYHFGGWSAGGIFAYRASHELIRHDEIVSTLILIDSPSPQGLDKLPQHFYDTLSTLGLFGQKAGATAPPEWLIPHFNATINMLHDYYADPLPEGRTPKTSIIWACDSVFDGKDILPLPPHPDDTEGMKFLSEKRTDFSPKEWSDLFPGEDIVVEKALGVNHFSMMQGKNSGLLAKFLDRAMA